MNKQDELDILNEESKRRQGLAKTRSELRKEKLAQRKSRRAELSAATSTRERRQIKEKYETVLSDIDTSIEGNKKARDNEPQSDKSDDIAESDTAQDLILSFEEETLDVVNDDNTAGQRVFLTRAV